MATDRELLKQAQSGHVASVGLTDPIAAVSAAHSSLPSFTKASDDAMASTTTSETYTGIYVKRKAKLNGIHYIATTGGVTANNTDYATVTVSKRDSSGGTKTTLATLTTTVTSSGNITQGAAKDLVLTAANVVIDAGSTITYEVAKAGSGVILRAGVFTLDLEWV